MSSFFHLNTKFTLFRLYLYQRSLNKLEESKAQYGYPLFLYLYIIFMYSQEVIRLFERMSNSFI